MIAKERLEELIKNCSVIYSVGFDCVESYDLSDVGIFLGENKNGEYCLSVKHCFLGTIDIEPKYLFETKEEAEWHREFGCIERTERLGLPTWEEVNKPHNVIVPFVNKDGLMCNLIVENYENKITVNGCGGCYDIWDLTKENYILACRKAKELFLGKDS